MYRRQPDKGNYVKRDILVRGYSSFFMFKQSRRIKRSVRKWQKNIFLKQLQILQLMSV